MKVSPVAASLPTYIYGIVFFSLLFIAIFCFFSLEQWRTITNQERLLTQYYFPAHSLLTDIQNDLRKLQEGFLSWNHQTQSSTRVGNLRNSDRLNNFENQFYQLEEKREKLTVLFNKNNWTKPQNAFRRFDQQMAKVVQLQFMTPETLTVDHRTIYNKLAAARVVTEQLHLLLERHSRKLSTGLETGYQTMIQQIAWLGSGLLAIWSFVVLGTFRVIRKSINAEQESQQTIRDNEYLLELTLNSIGDAVVATDADGCVNRMNPVAESMLGLSYQDAAGRPLSEILNVIEKQSGTRIEEPFKNALVNGTIAPTPSFKSTLIAQDGQEIEIADNAAPIVDENRRILGVIVTLRDITTEFNLRQQQQNTYRLLFNVLDLIPVRVYWKDNQNCYLGCNRLFALDAGFDDVRDVIGKTDEEIDWAEDNQSHISKNNYNIQRFTEEHWTARNGTEVILETYNSPLLDNNGKPIGMVTTYQDITHRKKQESALRRSNKMEAIGQLAGGLAHDFNNQLGIISGYLDFLISIVDFEEKPKKWVQTALEATQKCSHLTRRLLNVSQAREAEPSKTDLNKLINSLSEFIQQSLTPEIKLTISTKDSVWNVYIDENQTEDMLLNLALNAKDAMPNGGKLLIETTNKKLDQFYADIYPSLEPGDYVMIAVSDTGIGMSPKIVERIFEPFFTTKKDTKGTGLGLSMVYAFVKQSGGDIHVYSEESNGTTFRIYLPRMTEDDNDSNPDSINKQTELLPTGTELILIVDDEANLLKIAQTYLTTLGYSTVLANNGIEALKILESRSDIDLLFTDVVMPGGINGFQLADKALKIRPKLKILLTSGYTGQAIASNGLARFTNRVLNKPYTQYQLAQSIDKTLHKNDG